jgi:hypothetical protein
MKVAWAVAAAALVSVPILALPTRWAGHQEAGPVRYQLAGTGSRGTRVVVACPAGKGAIISVAVDGVTAPPHSDVGFRAANRTVVMHSDDHGRMQTSGRDNAAAFQTLWRSIRTGDTLEVSFTNGASARLPLAESVRDMAEPPCPVGYRARGLELTMR